MNLLGGGEVVKKHKIDAECKDPYSDEESMSEGDVDSDGVHLPHAPRHSGGGIGMILTPAIIRSGSDSLSNSNSNSNSNTSIGNILGEDPPNSVASAMKGPTAVDMIRSGSDISTIPTTVANANTPNAIANASASASANSVSMATSMSSVSPTAVMAGKLAGAMAFNGNGNGNGSSGVSISNAGNKTPQGQAPFPDTQISSPRSSSSSNSYRSPVPVLPVPYTYTSQHRWRSGRDPLHQRSGDSISRGGGWDRGRGERQEQELAEEGEAKHRPVAHDSCCACCGSGSSSSSSSCAYCGLSRVSAMCVSLCAPVCAPVLARWTFGRFEIESLCASVVYYWKVSVRNGTKCVGHLCSQYCGQENKPSNNSVSSSGAHSTYDRYSNNCLSSYGIYNTHLLLPALWTVLIPVELLQDFNELGIQVRALDGHHYYPYYISSSSSSRSSSF
jgi:hypothetical protein